MSSSFKKEPICLHTTEPDQIGKDKEKNVCCAANAPALESARRETALVSGGAQKRIGEPSCLGGWRPAAAEGLNENIAELGFKLAAEHGVRLIWQSGFNWNRRSSPRRSVHYSHYCPCNVPIYLLGGSHLRPFRVPFRISPIFIAFYALSPLHQFFGKSSAICFCCIALMHNELHTKTVNN